ncbi:adenylate cyclase type 9-like isoform X1 [Polyodon spathula]|uniref:adenylate cyclase type 9-like isoform X1 n=1 Tax=Polyodon spathula TaxID=7913 RepID=UPI001B7DA8D1|nr:adenylate cyclase type 9-like isoform X1 [Polyodon spathula]
MASPQHQQLLLHSTEVSCSATGDSVSVKINSKPQLHGPASSSSSSNSSSKHCKYSISSSCSSGESGVRRVVTTRARRPKKLPQLFERSSWQWWNPKFDSTNLEEACLERCFPQTQRRFRYVLFYLVAACLLWSIYFRVNGARCDQTAFLVPTLGFLVFCILLLLFTFTRFYARLYVWVSLLLFIVTFALTLSPQLQHAFFLKDGDFDNSTGLTNAAYTWEPCLSPVGTFSLCMEVLLLLYTIMHLHLYLCVLLGLVYSTLFEILGWFYFASDSTESNPLYWLAPAKALLHICAHAIGIHLFIMSEVRSRSTFLKVGQSIMHGKDLEVEKALKERMIHSVMPRMVADELMKQGDDESENSVKRYSTSSPKNKKKKPSIPKAQIIFRPFNMKRMEPVSILFADIVGFTKMSANKSAHALVGLLNDLFGRFDRLCEITNCEKISTLGDCYYCVAGCPEPRADHAYCCIEMGLGMIRAIEQFCQEKKEMVNMRVGVHTGTVLCGILGMRRFKFDVWSNDVNLANLMEQLGVAGKVHISEVTASFLDDRYLREDGRVMERVGQSVVADQLKGLLQSLSLVAASAGRNGTGAAADSSQQSCVDADSTYWGACRWRLKTYLISGRKVERSQCRCSQLGLAGSEYVDGASRTQTSETITTTEATHTSSQTDRTKELCPSCSVMLVPTCDTPTEDSTVQNGCQEDHKNNIKPIPDARCKTQNGLLSPPPEEKLTNSQTSLCEMLQEKEKGKWVGVSMDQSALLPLRFKNIRERTDAHFVDVIKEDSLMKDYFFKPPINKLSLNFLEKGLEMTYRISYQKEVKDRVPVKTFASSTFSSFIDVLLSSAVFLFLTIGCFLKPWVSGTAAPPAAVAVCVLAILLELLSLVLSVRMAFYLEEVAGCTKHLLQVISGWIPRHFIGAILISLPALAVFSHITCEFDTSSHFTMFICCAIIITIIQYCNFCQLSSWMRSFISTVVGVVLLILLYTYLYPEELGSSNSSVPETLQLLDLNREEVILAFFLLLLLVWFLNREFEVSYRLHYHGNVEADLHRAKIQTMRDQADWLLRNIIPYHVAEQLKVTQSYSKNHDNVGVIFASIVNFSEFYEENYEGGKECYRVLNELIGDFDELLNKQQYSNIEKIKTIGATYMAASGLNPSQCQDNSHPHRHLRTLFDFAKEMMCVVDNFNKDMLWFNFKLRIGFNHGPLTAGVIGTTKLLYDIWGDTVNIASRMDTTGVECRVQVSEESYRVLNEMGYDFDYRGTVNVKGKGQMKTFLFPKSVDSGMVPQHQLSVSPDIRVQVDGSIGRSPTDELANMVPSAGGHGLDRTPPQRAAAAMEKLDVKDSSGHLRAAPFAVSSPGNTQRPLPAQALATTATRNLHAEEEEGEEEEEEEEADELTKLKISESL